MKRINPILLGLFCSISAFSGELLATSEKLKDVGIPPDTSVLVGMSWNELANRAMVSIPKRNLGPGTMSGRVTAIAVPRKSPYQQLNRNTIYAGTASGGIWKSTNGGISWNPIFDEMDVQSIGALAVDPNNASVVWAGTGEGNPRNSHNSGKGIYKSLDGGKTWLCMGLEETRTIHRIIVNPQNSNQIFVAAMGSVWGADNANTLPKQKRGVYRSDDGGKTWKVILYVNETTGCGELVIDPQNPNKLYAAMYDYLRQPWTFRSGGPGSGLYITHNGGETWKRVSEKDGFPKGELGRIGVAVTASQPNRVYAIVEAKESGFYRSNDGGSTWQKVSTDANAGNRPFYYHEIYADPYNENRVYSIWSQISKSEDAGKSWSILANWGAIHPDHHAFLIHPDDPTYIINGNDGGLNISYDGGYSWRFAENIPVGQFYHIDVDNEIPYNIYGGLQDNGSWVGPGYHWKGGGITNWEWQEVLFGDGFDVAPVPGKPGEGYAMWQGGNVSRFNTKTHENTPIKPVHPEGLHLRFNWNAAMLVDPNNPKGLYFGSQYLHYSPDQGNSWKILSGDLTTNNPAKLQQAKSGGLTVDATGAEAHCTILAIGTAANDNGVIWVGTDDGNIQLTRDGGKTWSNVALNIKGLPSASWVPYLWVNPNAKGECWVVVNNYRQNDWGTYVYKTMDYGKTWKWMTNNNEELSNGKSKVYTMGNVRNEASENSQDMGYAWCVLPAKNNLVFMGTDRGLFVSFNGGNSWRKFKEFPSVPVSDMKIQPRENDLIVGTFGRGVWVLDDITMLESIAAMERASMDEDILKNRQFAGKTVKIVSTQPGYLARIMQNSGAHFGAGTQFEAPNKSTGVQLNLVFFGKKGKTDWEKTKIKGLVYDQNSTSPEYNKLIRTHRFSFDSSGIYRLPWRMIRDGYRFPAHGEVKEDGDLPWGDAVAPGKYKLVLTTDDKQAKRLDSAIVTVNATGQYVFSESDYWQKRRWDDTLAVSVRRANKAFEALKEAEKMIAKVTSANYTNDSINAELKKLQQPLLDSISTLKLLYMLPEGYRFYEDATIRLNDHLGAAAGLLGGNDAVTENVILSIRNAQRQTDKVLARVNTFFAKQYSPFVNLANSKQKDLKQIQLPSAF
jgi:photosystem II stability/assembly factor-like uncharacterized protein